MNDQEQASLLDQVAQELGAATEKLERYEQQVRREQGQLNDDIYAELKGEIYQARAALRRLRTQQPASVEEVDIEAVRRQAQEEAIAQLARKQGWTWEESAARWRTPEGNFYTRIGEPLND
ncbi:MAG: hypothetical protein AB7K24_05105 [Gemmataceae bacterium]